MSEGMHDHVGQPTKYKEEYDTIAYQLCLLGFIDKQIADTLGVTDTTINNWKIAHPSFFESIRQGKTLADGKMAESLFNSGIGNHYIEEEKLDKEGVPVTLRRQIPPNVQAQSLFLRNRQPDKWRNSVEVEAVIATDDMTEEKAEDIFIKVMSKAKLKAEQTALARKALLTDIKKGDD